MFFCLHSALMLVFLPGESHGQRSLASYSPWGCRVGHDWATNRHTFTYQRHLTSASCGMWKAGFYSGPQLQALLSTLPGGLLPLECGEVLGSVRCHCFDQVYGKDKWCERWRRSLVRWLWVHLKGDDPRWAWPKQVKTILKKDAMEILSRWLEEASGRIVEGPLSRDHGGSGGAFTGWGISPTRQGPDLCPQPKGECF